MAASLLHFGVDECNRVLLLRDRGYSVDLCLTLGEFHSTLANRAEAQAVLVPERPGIERREVVTLTRTTSRAALVLFSGTYTEEAPEFDLVIPPLDSPADWLQKIAILIEKSRALNSASRVIRDFSGRSIQDSEMLRQQSKLLREQSARERTRAQRLRAKFPKGS